ncbi:protein of unknown function [Pseudomonas sp. JV551A1]|uniref:Uncharacterized protein n=1 Tax=Pseudomonas inefficax TaxID=2078786 RepID=A0AAQ1PAM0_9PSED|nr:protein of unknown function [Pseudomonas sp. JV551A1]SPO61608.1 protein of unknown function [Pseudomonas inefficax]
MMNDRLVNERYVMIAANVKPACRGK